MTRQRGSAERLGEAVEPKSVGRFSIVEDEEHIVVGMREASAVATLAAKPLGAKLVYKPARAGKTPGTVLDQMPRSGGLSANDDVTLVVSKARYGLLPNFVGSSFADVQRELRRLKLRSRVSDAKGEGGLVLRQTPAAGVSVAPGLVVKLVVGDG